MKYVPVVGLEIHSQLATKTKIFCGCSTEFGGEPNTHSCPICLGMPGVLPVLNKHAVELAMRMALLTNEVWIECLSESIDRATERHNFHLVAFVYMPEHVHLLVQPQSDRARIDKLLYGIKRPFSFRVKRSLQTSGNALIEQLTVRERPGKTCFRFWQEGPGYDRNLTSVAKAIIAANYIHHNPVRRRLCASPDLWRWSSWKHYHIPDEPCDPALPRVHRLSA